jgi:glycosyltransferase involved in cell wall biosynthesis
MRFGGIAELVRDGVDGLLVPDDIAAWASALERLSGDRALVSRLRSNVRPVRPAGDVASDMLSMYRETA